MPRTINRVKERHNISVTLYNQGTSHIVKIYDFMRSKVTFKRSFDTPQAAVNFYDDIVIDDIKQDGTGIRGRYDYITAKLT